MNSKHYPRIVISGLSGDSGKTIVTCGLLVSLKNRGINVSAFKKGPDYIDSAWLSLASGKPARNLDSFMMGFPIVRKSFLKNADADGVNIIEGNRGLFDGMDSKGTHSTAELANLLQSPVVIVQDITKVTRTAAAAIIGCLRLDPKIKIEGVILNRTAGERHVKIVKEAIEGETGIPVLGAIPKLTEKFILPSRHLGLVLPAELEEKSEILSQLKSIVEENIDISKILAIAHKTSYFTIPEPLGRIVSSNSEQASEKLKIGYFRDSSFSFYYPENLEMLEEAGAELIPVSTKKELNPETMRKLEQLDTIYIGGGFPEINLKELAANSELKAEIKKLAEDGMPIYAECGGMMYLSDNVTLNGKKYALTGILPIEIKMHNRPQGHGYSEAIIDRENPFYEEGTIIKGHEFHYSKIYNYDPGIESTLSVQRGTGSINNRDGLIYKNVFAAYIHLHALANPEWITGMIKAAEQYKNLKKTRILIEG
jgi:cobyrinic acid a,c-diamide synthase